MKKIKARKVKPCSWILAKTNKRNLIYKSGECAVLLIISDNGEEYKACFIDDKTKRLNGIEDKITHTSGEVRNLSDESMGWDWFELNDVDIEYYKGLMILGEL